MLAQAGHRTGCCIVWRRCVLRAWDRQCAFCGYDGQLAAASVGIDAAHVRWFAFGGPDALDNGRAW
jgi:putative restriction endonuclease